MTVTRERFAQGMSYEQFKNQMTKNRERLEANERRLEIDPSDLAAFRDLSRPVDVLVIAEDWCGDVIDNLPILGRLAAESGKVNPQIFLRDQNLDLIDQYLKEGKYRSIPVFVFFDDQLNELGRFTERPASVTERRAQGRRDIFARHPEFGSPDAPPDQLSDEVRGMLSQAIATMRDEIKPIDNRDVVQSLRAIATSARTAPAYGRREQAGEGGPDALKKPVKVSITYCSDCGYQPQAMALANALLGEFQLLVSSLELIPWFNGAFDVSVNGELVHSMYRDGGFPPSETIARAIHERLVTAS
ncbi:MAG: SelT/SelW/SelH family protein [Candidatus Dormibacteraceae bacterium]